MIKKALEYIVGLAKPETLEIGGEIYSDKSLYRISHNPQANPIELHTLTSLIDYIRSGIDTMRGKMIIHVVSPTLVRMYSQLDDERERESGSVAEYGDDGITQKATVKTGLASKTDAVVPNPVFLVPFRTFPEVNQPGSSFVFRMKDDKYSGVQCGLFEADGGAWMNFAVSEIKVYLEDFLADYPDFFVIS